MFWPISEYQGWKSDELKGAKKLFAPEPQIKRQDFLRSPTLPESSYAVDIGRKTRTMVP
jgi:hypothetical protein